MTLEVVSPTWRSKTNVDDTVVFGGDLAANGSATASYANGAFSKERACALASTDYIELDFTFDAKTNGHGIAVGVAVNNPDNNFTLMDAAFVWDTDQHLKVFEQGSQRADIGVITLPMSCRIIYNAGALTWRSNAGVDTLRFTSLRTTAQILAIMVQGLNVDASFNNTSGKFHATLKGGTSSTPEIAMDDSTGRLGLQTLYAPSAAFVQPDISLLRTFEVTGFPPANPNPRPTVGKIWPRNK
jgi:hypothetical protein